MQIQGVKRGLPSAVRALGPKLLNQQCWCWGCDIRRNGGNLLVEYGFERWRAPEGAKGSSVYSLRLGAEVIVLWGWGLWYADGGAEQLYLPRYAFRPSLTAEVAAPAQVWRLEDIPATRQPISAADWGRVRELLAGAFGWISAYEGWVRERAGAAYRIECVRGWKRGIEAESMVTAWHDLGSACASCGG